MDSKKPDRLEQARIDKLEKIVALGHDPYGQRFDRQESIGHVRPQCPEESGVTGASVRIAGRILLRRKAGKLRFFKVADWSGEIQILCSRGDLGETVWELMSQFDLGDIVGVDGNLWRTDSGEVSIFATNLHILSKSLATPPEKFHGASDVEYLLRHRSVDLIYSPGVRDRLLNRTKIIQSVRKTLNDRGFIEAETPVLHAIAGGAAAKPFNTHHNALDMSLVMRIALELHLKRLLVGGIERVYELGRVFRNEGIDATHNPEFTMLEAYQAYGDYHTMMELTESIIVNAVHAVREDESLQIPWGDASVDLTPPWPRKTYGELFREHAGCEIGDRSAVETRARELAATGQIKPEFIKQLDSSDVHADVVAGEVFEAIVEEALTGPVFVTDYPASLCPLTKRKAGSPEIAERFELFIQGVEFANAYTELNDPRLQEELFQTQLAGLSEDESMAKMDTEFIRALKVGMPPAGGLGIGIDRLTMLLTNSHSIRDVIYFPLLRTEKP